MPKFMILMTESDNAWSKISPQEQEALLKRYFTWVDDLRKKDVFRGGEPLGGGGRVLRMAGGKLVDGPFTETKEVLTGFFLIETATLEEAAALAAGCPALGHGETVTVRPIGHI